MIGRTFQRACWSVVQIRHFSLSLFSFSMGSFLFQDSLPFLFYFYFSITLKLVTLFLISVLAMFSSFFNLTKHCFKKSSLRSQYSWEEVTATISWGLKREMRLGIVLVCCHISHFFSVGVLKEGSAEPNFCLKSMRQDVWWCEAEVQRSWYL